MKIEYDPNKNQRNIIKHGVDFEQGYLLDWDNALFDIDERKDYGETRYIGYIPLFGRLHIACFTLIEDGFRFISLRKANNREVKYYEQQTTHQ